jgi:hypothetical protein
VVRRRAVLRRIRFVMAKSNLLGVGAANPKRFTILMDNERMTSSQL